MAAKIDSFTNEERYYCTSQSYKYVLENVEEKNISSIAKIMQCSEGTIKSRLNYSRKNLKKTHFGVILYVLEVLCNLVFYK